MKSLTDKRIFLKRITVLLTCLGLQVSSFNIVAESTRAYIWGLAGKEDISRIDFLLPMVSVPYYLLYTDIQGKAATDSEWNAALGAGYRRIVNDRILGGYLFADGNVSDSHNKFYVLNPGLETLGNTFDSRINAYIPISGRIKHGPTYFTRPQDTCGSNESCGDSIFIGHQQFVQRFRDIEEVGIGIDAEAGVHNPRWHDSGIYTGVYYYHLHETNDLRGIEARGILGINASLALTVEATYDNLQGGAIVGGLRVQLGHVAQPIKSLNDRLYEPTERNIATRTQGTGTPIIRSTQKAGLELIRDNIFFFTGEGGTSFENITDGTFENPLAANQLTQATLDGIAIIAPNANLFFNRGTYVIEPGSPAALNARVTLYDGQSLFGRTDDYQCSATGNDRPLLLGGIDILFTNSNTLDSIRLSNSFLNPLVDTNTSGLNLQSARDVTICNSEITAEINVTDENMLDLFAAGITANNSEVFIRNSAINALINVGDDNSGSIGVASIGSNNADFAGNTFTIVNSNLTADASVIGVNVLNLLAVGIGTNATSGSVAFTANRFRLAGVTIDVATSNSLEVGFQFAAGVGGNASQPGELDFNLNNFDISSSEITATGVVTENLFNTNFASAIGINDFAVASSFESNNFILNSTQLNAFTTQPLSNGFSATTGIGNNVFLASDTVFNNNTFQLIDSAINSFASINGNQDLNIQFAAGIGSNNFLSVADFNFNNFIITNTQIDSRARVVGELDFSNQATAIGVNTRAGTNNMLMNSFSISNSLLSSLAEVGVITANAFNSAAGIGSNFLGTPTPVTSGNTFNIVDTTTISLAHVLSLSDDGSRNFSTAIGDNAFIATGSVFSLNTINATRSIFTSTALVDGNIGINAVNSAVGIGGNPEVGSTADFINNLFNISDSIINVNAIIIGVNNGTNQAIGFVAQSGVYNLFNDIVNVTAVRGSGNASTATAISNVVAIFNDSTTTYNVLAN